MKRSPLRRTPFRSNGSAKTRAGKIRLEQAKADVRGRSGGWCEADTPVCPMGRHHGHQIHHILPRSAGGQHEVGNLLHVCTAAHDWIHRNPHEARLRGLLQSRVAS